MWGAASTAVLRDAERDRLVLGAGRPVGRREVEPVVQEPARDEQELGLTRLVVHVDVDELPDGLAVGGDDVELVPVAHLER